MSISSDNEGSRMVEPRRKRRHSPSDRRREARRLVERIEEASTERRSIRAGGGHKGEVHRLNVELHGADAGEPKNYAPTKRKDPYLVSHGGLYEERRAGGGER